MFIEVKPFAYIPLTAGFVFRGSSEKPLSDTIRAHPVGRRRSYTGRPNRRLELADRGGRNESATRIQLSKHANLLDHQIGD